MNQKAKKLNELNDQIDLEFDHAIDAYNRRDRAAYVASERRTSALSRERCDLVDSMSDDELITYGWDS